MLTFVMEMKTFRSWTPACISIVYSALNFVKYSSFNEIPVHGLDDRGSFRSGMSFSLGVTFKTCFRILPALCPMGKL
jgi:hypothetical protein